MKFCFRVLLFVFLLNSSYLTGYACTCVNADLSKRFKKAEAVFVGEVYEFEDADIPKIQNYQEGLPVLLVSKSWKGVKKELIAVDFNFKDFGGNCPALMKFEEDAEYLVFAYGKDLKVEVECSDTQKLQAKYDGTVREISKLNSFWFRFWSRYKPF